MSELSIGQSAKMTKIVLEEDVKNFGTATGDINPIHLDNEYAMQTAFGQRIAHGLLIGGMISAVLGTQLPGPGTIYLSQSLQFRAPVFIGDEITAVAEVIHIRSDKPVVTIHTTCINQNQQIVVEGDAVVLVPNDNNQ